MAVTLFDITTPRAFAYQAMRRANIDVEKIIRATEPDDREEHPEIEVLYVTSTKDACIAYVRTNGTVSGYGLPW